MNYIDCFRALARRRTDEIVVTSAGNSSQAWWAVTRDSEASFYLDASMSLSTMFASGLALAQPQLKIWAFMGDGAFCMNPGMLMVEREMNLPNLTHFLVSNRTYGGTSNAVLPNFADNDYAAMARAMGLERKPGGEHGRKAHRRIEIETADGIARRRPPSLAGISRRRHHNLVAALSGDGAEAVKIFHECPPRRRSRVNSTAKGRA